MPLFSENKMLALGTKVIAVRVGAEPNHTDFTIHETLVRKSSPFFELALSKEWRESEERMVRLTESDAAAFNLYVQWLYTERLHVSPPGSSSLDSEGTKLLRGYVLGEFLQNIKYQDTVMDALREWMPKNLEDCAKFISASVKTVYADLGDGSPLRKFLVDLTVWRTEYEWLEKADRTFPGDFFRDVTIGHARSKAGINKDPLGLHLKDCTYHGHKDKLCDKTEKPSVPSSVPAPATPIPAQRRKRN